MEKSYIKDKLRQQIKENQERKRKHAEESINYGLKLNELAISMQKKEEDRLKRKDDMQREHLRAAWNEQRKIKEDLQTIEKIFK